MALDGSSMGDAIKAAIDGVSDKNDRNALFEAMGQAIVAHIKANAELHVTVTVTSVTGVTPGPSTSGPGSGSGTGTIT